MKFTNDSVPNENVSDEIPTGAASAADWGIKRVASTGSTNADLLVEAASGSPGPTALVADHQTAGRGRLDRRWEAAPSASLLTSLLVRPTVPVTELWLVGAALGCAAAAAVGSVAGVDAQLKWPNDLVVPGGGKLAGTLAERSADGALVIGIGLNIAWPDDAFVDELAGGTSLAQHSDADVDRDELFTALLDGFAQRFAAVEARETTALIAELRTRSATIGRNVAISLPSGEVLDGEAIAIDDDGRLRLRLTDGAEQSFAVGDIVHATLSSNPPS